MSGPAKYYWDSCVFIDWLKGEQGKPTRNLDGIREVVELFNKREAILSYNL